jgi:G protein beta subunit-like protein
MSIFNDQVIFATAGYDHTIKLWKPHTGFCNRTFTHNDSVSDLIYLDLNK